MASGGRDRIVRVWDVASGDLLKSLVGHSADIVGLDFSPDGKWLASGAQSYTDGIKLWDMSAPATPFQLPSTANAYWDWSLLPDGHRLVAAGQVYKKSGPAGIIDIFDLDTGQRCSRSRRRPVASPPLPPARMDRSCWPPPRTARFGCWI